MHDTSQRVSAVRARLRTADVDGLIVRGSANVGYLSGFVGVWDDEPCSLILLTPDDAVVFTDSRYLEAAEKAAEATPWRLALCKGDPWIQALERAAELGVARLAVEASSPYAVVEHAKELFAGEIVVTDRWVESERAVKDVDEIATISAAQAVADVAFDHVLGWICEGQTESQVALELEFYMRSHGSQGVAFPPIVASGPNAALPHAHPGARVLERGDFLVMDFGARVGGYCSDMTRTVVIGEASDRQREIYETVLSANQAGIEAVAPGALGSEIDAAARAVVESRGFGECFGHGLGHGVGLEVHELPSLGPRSMEPVPLGSVMTIEPGIYVPGLGGVRIEDLVTVEDTGARVLTRSAKELIEL